jgi:hypothetical protein
MVPRTGAEAAGGAACWTGRIVVPDGGAGCAPMGDG